MKSYLTFILEFGSEFSIQKIAAMFGLPTENIKVLGSGSYGKAYKVGDKVIKITTDEDEYKNALKLSGKPVTKYLINYYDARRISEYNDYYILLMDYATPLNDYTLDTFLPINRLYDRLQEIIGTWKQLPTQKEIDEFLNSGEIEKKIKEISDNIKLTREEIIDKFMQIYYIYQESKKNNVSASDVHSGNVGIKDGHYVYFDIGCDYISRGKPKHVKSWKFNDLAAVKMAQYEKEENELL